MISNNRNFYCFITFLVMLLGILSRKIDSIPLVFGDILYAVMVYFGCRMFLLHNNKKVKVLLPLVLCYLIEWQQCYDSPWILAIRNTTLGHYILGQGFLWSDLVCYTVGVVGAFFVDSWIKVSRSKKQDCI